MYLRLAGKRNNIKKNHSLGFTLLEVMVTSGILVIVSAGLLISFIHCINLNQANNNLVIAANDAQYVIEEMKTIAYSGLSSYVTGFNSSRFINLTDESINIVFTPGLNVSTVTVQVTWTERQRQNTYELTTKIARQKIAL